MGRRPAVSGIVLAGGRSTRFGRDKLAEPVAGRPLLDHAVRAVAAVATDVVVLGGGGPRSPVGNGVRSGVTVRRAADEEPFAGPLVALATGLRLVRAPIVLVVAGDMPTLAPAVLAALVDALDQGDGWDAAALLARTRPQPLPLALRVDPATAAVGSLVQGGERRLGALLAAVRTRALHETVWRALDPDGATLRDIDVPADLLR